MKKTDITNRKEFLRTNNILAGKKSHEIKKSSSIKKIERKQLSAKTINNLTRKNPLIKKLDAYLGNDSASGKTTTTIDRRTSARKGAIARGAREMTEAQLKAIAAKKSK